MSVPHVAGPAPAGRPQVIPYLEGLARSLGRAAERTRGQRDPDAIHDLRVTLRRMSVGLSMWGSDLERRPRRRAARSMRRLRRRMGRPRDLEVLLEQVEHMRVLDPRGPAPSGRVGDWLLSLSPQRSSAVLSPLASELRLRVERARRRAARTARRPRMRKLFARWRSCLTGLEQLSDAGWEHARDSVTRWRGAALEVLDAARESGDERDLHRARIAVKKWRYALESWCAVVGQEAAEISALRDVQLHLGSARDAAQLRDLLARRAARDERHGRPALAAVASLLQGRAEAQRLATVPRVWRAVAALRPASSAPA